MMRSERGDMCLPKVMGILFIGTLLNGVCGCSFTIMNNYSYAYDDSSSTFTCTGADYTITFCPTMASEKKSNNPPPVAHNNSTMDNNDNSQWGASAVGDTANQSQISISSSYSLSIALTIGLLSLIILTLTNASH